MTNRKIRVVISMVLLCVALCLVGVISCQFEQPQNAYAAEVFTLNISSSLTGVNPGVASTNIMQFASTHTASGYNQVGNFFTGEMTQRSNNENASFMLKITCSDTNAISWANNGCNYYNGNYSVAVGSDDEYALIMIWGSDNESDYKALSNYASSSTSNLQGNVITSRKTIKREGTSTTSISFTSRYKYMWYQIVYQWSPMAEHNNSYLVVGQSAKFTVDREAPVGKLINVENDGYTKNDVSFTWTEDGATATLDGKSYSSGQTISDEGKHTIRLRDGVGNVNEYTFTIDKTSPTLSCSNGVTSNSYTNSLVTVTVSDTYDTKLYYKQPDWMGFSATSDNSFTITAVNGTWDFYAVDIAGNQSNTFSFKFDNVAPDIGLRRTDNTGFADGAWVNQGVYFDVKDTAKLKSTKLYQQVNDDWEIINSEYISGTVYYDNRNPDILYGSRNLALAAVLEAENSRVSAKSNWETIPNDTRIIATGQIDYAMTGADYWEYLTSNNEIYVFFVQSDIAKFIASRAGNYVGYSSRDMFMQEGYFKIVAEDEAGNTTEKTFHIKLDLPTIEIEPSGYANSIRYKVTDSTSLTTYVRVNNGDWVLKESSDLTFGASDVEGTYYFKTIDAAGNVVTASVVLDVTAPILSLKKNNITVDSSLYLKGSDILSFSINDKNNARIVELDGVQYATLPAMSTLEDGVHTIFALDKAGNKSTTIQFTIDNVAPTLDIEELDGTAIIPEQSSGEYYTNDAVRFASEDINFAFLCVYLNGTLLFKGGTTSVDYAAIEQNYGTYKIYAEDLAGNRSEEKTLILQVINDFGNLADAYKSYKINAWFEVTLPSYVFGTGALEDISGRYSFEKYEDAYTWSLEMEEKYRVQQVTDGWIYISATNESLSQKYYSRIDLDKVLNKYASRYVSARKIASTSGNDNYYTIKDESGRNDEYAFVRQSMTLPSFLSDYSEFELLQMRSSFAYKKSTNALAPTFVTLTYLADDFSMQERKTLTIYPGNTIKTALENANMYRQGYYLVNEQDLCGNSQKYVVYIDIEAPKIRAEVEMGDSTRKEVVFDKDYSEENANIFYFLSFTFDKVFDNVDDFTTVKIEGRGLTSAVFIQGDELPVLDASLGGGQYTITVYDRSCNIFQFKVNIANKVPTMEYNSLRPTNRQLTLYFVTNDTLNQIVRLEIYKINGAGERIQIEQDDLGKQIDFTTLEYNFTTGGKFFAIITDRYGRVIETEPIFYERGLPSGELSTTVNGVTNKDVYFNYSLGNGVIVYTYDENNNYLIYTDYLLEYDNLNKVYTLGFLASEGLERQYMIHLYNEADDNLYIEYKFGIDTIVASVSVIDANKVTIDKGGYTNQAFSLNWTEANVRVKYTVGLSSMTSTYSRGDMLYGNGMYTFTVTDRVGNTETFTIYLDNVVDYTLEGNKIVNVGGKYLTNAPVALSVNETIAEWIVADNKDVVNRVPITAEGVYTITVSDRYGNTVVIVIEIDLTAPQVTLQGVENNGATKDSVTLTFEDGAKAYLMRGNVIIRELSNGEIFSEHGTYTIRAEDLAGNTTECKFTVDSKVDYTSNIVNRQITTEIVAFSLSEEGSIEVLRDGQAVDVAKTYSESGKYLLTATDGVGNALIFTFTILPKNAQELSIKLDENQVLASSKLNGDEVKLEFSDVTKKNIELTETGKWILTISDIEQNQSYTVYVNIDNVAPSLDLVWSKNTVAFSKLNKDGVTAKLTHDGAEIKWSQSLVVKDPGHYALELSDEFGNVTVIEWDIKYKLNGLSITLIVFGCLAVVGIVVLIIVKRFKFKVS